MSNYAYNIRLRYDTENNWALSGNSIVLDPGEIGIATTSLDEFIGMKVGDGSTDWDTLGYLYSDNVSETQMLSTSGLTNYYLKTSLYTKTQIDDNLDNNYYDRTQVDALLSGYTETSVINSTLSNYYTQTQIDTALGDYATISYLGSQIDATSGRTNLINYYDKTSSDNKYLYKNSGYTFEYNTNNSSLYLSLNKTTTSESSVFKIFSDVENSINSIGLSVESQGDKDTKAIFSKGTYTGTENQTTSKNLWNIVSGLKTENSNGGSASKTVVLSGVYANSDKEQNGSNIGIIANSNNADFSNIGLLAGIGLTESNIKNMDGGVLGTAVYASNSGGYAIKLEGGVSIGGSDGVSGSFTTDGKTVTVTNGIITAIV